MIQTHETLATATGSHWPYRRFDHVTLRTQNTDAMVAFYCSLGFDVVQNQVACSVYIAIR